MGLFNVIQLHSFFCDGKYQVFLSLLIIIVE